MPFLDYTGLTTFWNKVKAILSGKQNTLTAGEGVSLENDTVGVQEPVKGITRAQYDALTEGQKNTGLYVITDANINLSDRGDVYSTEETRIGTWIDGKPLYRKTFQVSIHVPFRTVTTLVDASEVSALNIDTFVKIDGGCKYLYGDSAGGYEYRSLNNLTIAVKLTNAGIIQIYVSDSSIDVKFVFMEYTKTTDTAPASKTALLTSNVDLPQTMTLTSSPVVSDSPLTGTFPNAVTTASASASSYFIASASASSTKLGVVVN